MTNHDGGSHTPGSSTPEIDAVVAAPRDTGAGDATAFLDDDGAPGREGSGAAPAGGDSASPWNTTAWAIRESTSRNVAPHWGQRSEPDVLPSPVAAGAGREDVDGVDDDGGAADAWPCCHRMPARK